MLGFVGGQFDKKICCYQEENGIFLAHLGGSELQNTRDFSKDIGSTILDFLYSKVAKANY